MKSVFVILGILFLIFAVYIYISGIPNFSNLKEERSFCSKWGGMAIEPSKKTYNEMICIFDYEDTGIIYDISKVTNQEWKELFDYKYDYCFICYNSYSCSSLHNDILREKGVHC